MEQLCILIQGIMWFGMSTRVFTICSKNFYYKLRKELEKHELINYLQNLSSFSGVFLLKIHF